MVISYKEREILRKNVKIFFGKNPSAKQSNIVQHFMKEGYARSTIYNAIDRLPIESSLQDAKRTGRKGTWTSTRTAKLEKLANNKKGTSSRKLGQVFEVDQSTIVRKLANMGLNYHKREKTPKYTRKKLAKVKRLCRDLSTQINRQKVKVVLDDEKYFLFSGDSMPGNDGYYSRDKNSCPDEVRFKGVDKYPDKILVWIAISEDGVSEPLVRPNKAEAINADTYIKECLKKRLLPFIETHHSDGEYIFWPDLASSHYAKATLAWMDQNVNYVAKSSNPPNVPQARPIENFWGCLSQKVYEGGWEASSEAQLVRRIKAKIKEFDQSFFQDLMRGTQTKLRNISDHGVFYYLKK
jgi:hypothetical protein